MRRFTDTKNREWEIAVTVGTAKRVRDLVQVDLFKIHETLASLESLEGIEKLVNILFAVIEPQAKSQGVTDVDFGESLGGETLKTAWESLLGELIDFFRSWNPPLAATLRKSWEAATLLLDKATAAVDSIALPSATATPVQSA